MITKEGMTFFFTQNDALSNWYISDFEIKGVRFNCVEQFMMYCKAKLFGDESTAMKILEAPHPRVQKALGRAVVGFDDEKWVARRRQIVEYGCYAKFSQNEALRGVLLTTGDTLLVEASPYDRIWGIGLAANDPRALDPSKWKGQNLLGQALTQVRERLTMAVSADNNTTDEQQAAPRAKRTSMRMG